MFNQILRTFICNTHVPTSKESYCFYHAYLNLFILFDIQPRIGVVFLVPAVKSKQVNTEVN